MSLSVKEKYKNNVGLAEAPLSRAIFKVCTFSIIFLVIGVECRYLFFLFPSYGVDFHLRVAGGL